MMLFSDDCLYDIFIHFKISNYTLQIYKNISNYTSKFQNKADKNKGDRLIPIHLAVIVSLANPAVKYKRGVAILRVILHFHVIIYAGHNFAAYFIYDATLPVKANHNIIAGPNNLNIIIFTRKYHLPIFFIYIDKSVFSTLFDYNTSETYL